MAFDKIILHIHRSIKWENPPDRVWQRRTQKLSLTGLWTGQAKSMVAFHLPAAFAGNRYP